ncbi:UNVERIFIED_CONTAM: hypothetical protein HDU68_011727 [Siphonaria sp. JEL0065]|nr:hypothetical protein HDU68_011727 [Siphonaria sp. JEL0065]
MIPPLTFLAFALTALASLVAPDSAANSEFDAHPAILLVGDSITQLGFNGAWLGWAAFLSDHIRFFRQEGSENVEIQRNVYNRGYGGYTTRHFTQMFSDIVKATATRSFPHPSLTTIFLGANDAAVDKDISVQEYTNHLLSFANYYTANHPNSKLLFITPPAPVCQCEYDNGIVNILPIKDSNTGGDFMHILPIQDGKTHHLPLPSPSNNNDKNNNRNINLDPTFRSYYSRPTMNQQNATRLYRDAVITLANNLSAANKNIGVMDTWEMMFGKDPVTGNVVYDRDVADSLYYDGLHYNSKGDFLHFSTLVGVVKDLWPDLGF